jgi:hypothetical protein
MKRSNGEGTIEWREGRKRYVARVRVAGTTVTATGRTQSEAWDSLDKKLSVNSRALVGLPKQPTLESWWEYARAEITLDGNARTAANRHANILRYVATSTTARADRNLLTLRVSLSYQSPGVSINQRAKQRPPTITVVQKASRVRAKPTTHVGAATKKMRAKK